MNDSQLILTILKAQCGDRDALDALFSAIQESIFRCVFGIVDQADVAEDITQDVFIILQRALKHLRDPLYFRPWAYRIAVREALRQVKKERKRNRRYEDIDLAGLAETESNAAWTTLERDEIRQLVATVSPACRAVLVLHYLEDLPLPDVADILGIPIGTAKSRLSYGLQALRNKPAIVGMQDAST